jgi:glycosyltransferase involved in cell wall biosynthesis
MRILTLASMTPTTTANYLVRALREIGHEVRVCSDVLGDAVDERVRGEVDVASLMKRLRFSPDAVLFVEGGSMRLLPVCMEGVDCVTAWYGIDTHMDYAKHLRLGRLFDVSFIAQRDYVERLRADGLTQVEWLPLGFAPELMPDPMPERTIDIAHVGSSNISANPERHRLMSLLKERFPSNRFGPASPVEMGRLYASARLVFNRSIANDVNMRFFEAAGAGAVLVTDPIVDNGADELFDDGRHYVTYRSDAQLLGIVAELLANRARASSMGEAARELVLARHTYGHRAKQMLDVIARSKKRPPPTPEDELAACLSLDLVGGAMKAFARAVKSRDGGRYRRLVGSLLAAPVSGLGRALSALESFRGS